MENFACQLLAPISLDDYLSNYFEKKHLHIQSNAPDRFSNLLSFEKLDLVLGQQGLDSNRIRVVSAEKEIEPPQYTWARGMVDPIKVAQLFASGATIIFNNLQDYVAELSDFCSNISSEINRKTQSNIYLTPAGSQGFQTHWDTHDVFVLQVEGTKHWQIYKENFPLPFDTEKHGYENGAVDAKDIVDEITMNPGDILYIPRGVMHSARSSDDKSLHITFGIIPYTVTEIFKDCIDLACAESTEWREGLPLGTLTAFELKEMLHQKLGALLELQTIESVFVKHIDKVKNNYRPRASNFLKESTATNELSIDDQVLPYGHAQIQISESEDKSKLHLSDGNREIILPLVAKKTIDLIFSSSDIKIGDFEDDIDWQSRQLVISKVLSEGFAYRKRA